ncbi:MAG: MFS transporter [Nitrosomonas sp.]|nr:MAG: MFS transporter [Nitrosomonas sp.]
MTCATSNSRAIAWSIWIIASIFYAYQYILRVMPNIMLGDIMQQFDIGAATFGQFSGVYYIGYSLMHLPIGLMLDRFGPRKVMTSCIVLTVVGLLPLIFSDHWIYPIVGRLLIGMGSSAAILGVFKIIRMTFSEARFTRMLSLSVTIGLIGAIYGGGPLDFMRVELGYHVVVEIFAVVGVILAVVTYWAIPEMEGKIEGGVWDNIKEVLTNGRVLCSCAFAGLMVGPLEGFADVWGSAFLKQVYGFDSGLSGTLPSMIFIGMCFGSPVLNLVAEKIGNYLVTIIAAGVVMTISFCMMLAWQLPSTALSVLFVLVGVCAAYQILAIYKASTYAREQVAGLTTAVANMIIMIFGYGFHTAMGSTIAAMGGSNVSEALVYGVAVIPIALCIGTVGFAFLFIQERRGCSVA